MSELLSLFWLVHKTVRTGTPENIADEAGFPNGCPPPQLPVIKCNVSEGRHVARGGGGGQG